MNVDDRRVRFRVCMDAQLVDETWVDIRSTKRLRVVERVWARDQRLIRRAQVEHRAGVIDVRDPTVPKDRVLRFGTDETLALGLGALGRRLTAPAGDAGCVRGELGTGDPI